MKLWHRFNNWCITVWHGVMLPFVLVILIGLMVIAYVLISALVL